MEKTSSRSNLKQRSFRLFLRSRLNIQQQEEEQKMSTIMGSVPDTTINANFNS